MFWSNDDSKPFRGDKSQETQQTNSSDCNYQEDFVLQLHLRSPCTLRETINLLETKHAVSAHYGAIVQDGARQLLFCVDHNRHDTHGEAADYRRLLKEVSVRLPVQPGQLI